MFVREFHFLFYFVVHYLRRDICSLLSLAEWLVLIVRSENLITNKKDTHNLHFSCYDWHQFKKKKTQNLYTTIRVEGKNTFCLLLFYCFSSFFGNEYARDMCVRLTWLFFSFRRCVHTRSERHSITYLFTKKYIYIFRGRVETSWWNNKRVSDAVALTQCVCLNLPTPFECRRVRQMQFWYLLNCFIRLASS